MMMPLKMSFNRRIFKLEKILRRKLLLRCKKFIYFIIHQNFCKAFLQNFSYGCILLRAELTRQLLVNRISPRFEG